MCLAESLIGTGSAFPILVGKKSVKWNGHERLSYSPGEKSGDHEGDNKNMLIGHLHDDDHRGKRGLNDAGKKGDHAKQRTNLEIGEMAKLGDAESQAGTDRQAGREYTPGHSG